MPTNVAGYGDGCRLALGRRWQAATLVRFYAPGVAERIMGETERPRILVLVEPHTLISPQGRMRLTSLANELPGSHRLIDNLSDVNLSEWDAMISFTGQVPDTCMRRLRGFCHRYNSAMIPELTRSIVAGRRVVRPDFGVDRLAADFESVIVSFLEYQATQETKQAFLKTSEPADNPPKGLGIGRRSIIHLPSGESLALSLVPDAFPSSEWIVIAGDTENPFEWLRACLVRWNRSDPVAFPLVTWRESESWMTANETRAQSRVAQVQQKRRLALEKLDEELADAQKRLETLSAAANDGERRLLTSSGDQLVEAVKNAFERLGLSAEDQDAVAKEKGHQKLEDLRVTLPSKDGWVALVEVKGKNRATSANDVGNSFRRPVTRFALENQREPDALWFVANSERNLDPTARSRPLHSSTEDLRDFNADGGLLVWSVDLFRLIRALDLGQISAEEARDLFLDTTGRLTLPCDIN